MWPGEINREPTTELEHALGFGVLATALVMVFLIGLRWRSLLWPMLVGFVLRAAVLLIDTYLVDRFPYATSADSRRFHRYAVEYAQLGVEGVVAMGFPSGSSLYVRWMSLVYAFTGTESWFVIRSINLLLAMTIIASVWHGARLLWGENAARRSVWFAVLMPTLVFYSVIPNREAMVTAPLAAATFCLLYSYYRRSQLALGIGAALLVLSAGFHSGVVVALGTLVVGAALRALWLALRGDRSGVPQLIVGVPLAAAALLYVQSTGWGLDKFGGDLTELDAETIIDRRDRDPSEARAAYLQELKPSNPIDILWQSPIRVAFFLFSPFPWMVTSAWDLVGLLDMSIYLSLAWGTWCFRRRLFSRPGATILLAVLGSLIFAYAWGTSNYGTAMRHRAKMFPLLVMIAPAVWNPLTLRWLPLAVVESIPGGEHVARGFSRGVARTRRAFRREQMLPPQSGGN